MNGSLLISWPSSSRYRLLYALQSSDVFMEHCNSLSILPGHSTTLWKSCVDHSVEVLDELSISFESLCGPLSTPHRCQGNFYNRFSRTTLILLSWLVLRKMGIFRIRCCWETNGALHSSQYGFRRERSCASAVMQLINCLETADEEKCSLYISS